MRVIEWEAGFMWFVVGWLLCFVEIFADGWLYGVLLCMEGGDFG